MNTEYFEDKGKTLDCTGVIQITDPCYEDDNIWCRTETEAAKGVWHCYSRVVSDECGERVHHSMVCREGCLHVVENVEPEFVDVITVDSGLAGFFFSPKPNYDSKTWEKMVDDWAEMDKCRGRDGYFFDNGFITSTGLGDGRYQVLAFRENEEIVALVIDYWGDLEFVKE